MCYTILPSGFPAILFSFCKEFIWKDSPLSLAEIMSYRNLGEISEIFAIIDRVSVTYGGRKCKEKNCGVCFQYFPVSFMMFGNLACFGVSYISGLFCFNSVKFL